MPVDAPPPVHRTVGPVTAALRGDGGAVGAGPSSEGRGVHTASSAVGGYFGGWPGFVEQRASATAGARPVRARRKRIRPSRRSAKSSGGPTRPRQAEDQLDVINKRYMLSERAGEVPPTPPKAELTLLALESLASEMERLNGRMEARRRFGTEPVTHGVPHFLPTVATAVLPAAWLITFVTSWPCRRGRRSGNHCMRCGYDLRATPGRCPECGTPGPAEVTA
jgi:hypothetical protein